MLNGLPGKTAGRVLGPTRTARYSLLLLTLIVIGIEAFHEEVPSEPAQLRLSVAVNVPSANEPTCITIVNCWPCKRARVPVVDVLSMICDEPPGPGWV